METTDTENKPHRYKIVDRLSPARAFKLAKERGAKLKLGLVEAFYNEGGFARYEYFITADTHNGKVEPLVAMPLTTLNMKFGRRSVHLPEAAMDNQQVFVNKRYAMEVLQGFAGILKGIGSGLEITVDNSEHVALLSTRPRDGYLEVPKPQY